MLLDGRTGPTQQFAARIGMTFQRLDDAELGEPGRDRLDDRRRPTRVVVDRDACLKLVEFEQAGHDLRSRGAPVAGRPPRKLLLHEIVGPLDDVARHRISERPQSIGRPRRQACRLLLEDEVATRAVGEPKCTDLSAFVRTCRPELRPVTGVQLLDLDHVDRS